MTESEWQTRKHRIDARLKSLTPPWHVRWVEASFALADQIEAQFHTSQSQVVKLTLSLLARAFRSQLIPQDPADEPAEKLLERTRRNAESKA